MLTEAKEHFGKLHANWRKWIFRFLCRRWCLVACLGLLLVQEMQMNSDSVLQIGFLGLSLWIVSALIDEERLLYNGEHDVPCSLTRLICIVNAMQIYNLFQRLPSVSQHIFVQKQKTNSFFIFMLPSACTTLLREDRLRLRNESKKFVVCFAFPSACTIFAE